MKKGIVVGIIVITAVLTTAVTFWILSGIRIVNTALRIANHPLDDKAAQRELLTAWRRSGLIVHATVRVADTTVHEWGLTHSDNYRAIEISPHRFLKGWVQQTNVLVEALYEGLIAEDSVFPRKCTFTNGEQCVFFLKRRRDLTVHKAPVFERVKVVQVK